MLRALQEVVVRLMRQALPALIAVVFLLTIPTDADAQLRWIRKFSGPEYTPAYFYRVGLCIGKRAKEAASRETNEQEQGGDDNNKTRLGITCGTFAVGGALRTKLVDEDLDRDWEFQVALAVTRGLDGDNLEAGISDTRIWIVEPQLRALWLNNGKAPAVAFTGGFGWHTFSGGTIPEKFSAGALIVSVGGVYPNPLDVKKWAISRDGSVRLFVEAGFNASWFPQGLLNSQFGGTTADDEVDTIGSGGYAMLGVRWGR